MFNRQWLLQREWYPVVDEDDFPFMDEEIERLIQTLNLLDIKKLVAVNIEGAKAFPSVVTFPCTAQGYRALIKEMSIVGMLIFDKNVQFTLLTTHATFYIFASSYKTVQRFYDGRAFEVILKYREAIMREIEPYQTYGLKRYELCRFYFDLAKPKHEK
jgi:hypothetical protein